MHERQIIDRSLRGYLYDLLLAGGVLVCFSVISVVCLSLLLGRVLSGQAVERLLLFVLCSGLLSAAAAGLCLWRCIGALRRYRASLEGMAQGGEAPDAPHDDPAGEYVAAQAQFFAALNAPAQSGQKLTEDQKQTLLYSQINPHFLYNTIDSIRGQAMKEGFDTVASMLDCFAIMARDTFRTTEALRSLAMELKSAQSYIEIQQFRFYEKFTVEYHIDTEDPAIMAYLLPSLSLQPLIENAILHGIDSYDSGGKITITVQKTGHFLSIQIRDNGVGIKGDILQKLNMRLQDNTYTESDALHDFSGIALLNINARIKYYYGMEYGLHLTSLKNWGTCVEMLLPEEGVPNAD